MFKTIQNFVYPDRINKSIDVNNFETKNSYKNDLYKTLLYNNKPSGIIINDETYYIMDEEIIKKLDQSAFNYIFYQHNFGLQPLSKKYIPSFENELITKYARKKADIKFPSTGIHTIVNSDYCKKILKQKCRCFHIYKGVYCKLFNYEYKLSKNSYNEKYLKFARRFGFDYRYKVYVMCCRYGNDMFELLNLYPFLIFKLINKDYEYKNIKNICPQNIKFFENDLSNAKLPVDINLNYPKIKQELLLKIISYNFSPFISSDLNILNKINKLIPYIFNDHKLYLEFYRQNKRSYTNLSEYLCKMISLYDFDIDIKTFLNHYNELLELNTIVNDNLYFPTGRCFN